MKHAIETTFDGHAAVQLNTGRISLTAVRAFGPRIAALSLKGGDSILLWKPARYTRGDWDLRGGHRVWVTRPGADENEDTYASDNAPCDLDLMDDGFRLTGAENPVNRTRRGFHVSVLTEDTLEVDNFVTNTGDMLYSGGLWALTCTVPSTDTRYGIPIGDCSSWDVFTLVSFRQWAGHGEGGFSDPQFNVMPDALVVNPAGKENKRMVQSHAGIIAMSDPTRGLTFAKRTPLQPAGQYPLGTNIAIYIGPDNFMVEMETMGPERTLKPGETLHHIETWRLVDEALPADDAGALRQLFL